MGSGPGLGLPQPSVLEPALIPGMSGRLLAAGAEHSLVSDGRRVYGFGRNQYGELALSPGSAILPPTLLPIQLDVKLLRASAHRSMILTTDGVALSFGWGGYGQLGLGSREDVGLSRANPGRC